MPKVRGTPGAKPGERRGGREKGTPNKATQERENRLAELMQAATEEIGEEAIEAMTPLEVLTFGMHLAAKMGMWFKAVDIAEMAAPFVHPKLQVVVQNNFFFEG